MLSPILLFIDKLIMKKTNTKIGLVILKSLERNVINVIF
jgi:hypothetical protein